jgi:hypothetical protein
MQIFFLLTSLFYTQQRVDFHGVQQILVVGQRQGCLHRRIIGSAVQLCVGQHEEVVGLGAAPEIIIESHVHSKCTHNLDVWLRSPRFVNQAHLVHAQSLVLGEKAFQRES